MIPRMRVLPTHHVVTSNVGGQSGKSTLVINLAAYLAQSPNASTIMIVDAAAPEDGTFKTFANIFNSGPQAQQFLDFSPCIRAPKRESVSTRNLLIVQAQRNQVRTWDDLVHKVNILQEECVHNGHRLTHVVTETNLQPTDLKGEYCFTNLDYQALAYWTVWNHESLDSTATYSNLDYYENISADRSVRFYYVHSTYQDQEGWVNSRMPAVEACYYKVDVHNHKLDSAAQFMQLCRYAQMAKSKGISGNEYWEHVYKDYLAGEADYRPGNLFPVFQRSRTFFDTMTSRFSAVDPLEDILELANLLDMNSDNLYSNVYQPYFRSMGAI